MTTLGPAIGQHSINTLFLMRIKNKSIHILQTKPGPQLETTQTLSDGSDR